MLDEEGHGFGRNSEPAFPTSLRRGLLHQPLRTADDGPRDSDGGRGHVDVRPSQGEQLAPPVTAVRLQREQVVAYNFRAGREMRGWTQEETARRLAPYVGQELSGCSAR